MPKILLVDDVKLLLEIQKKYLATSMVDIFTAANGAEALEVAGREMPDLIVMDRHMPVMDGLTSCTALKADPGLRHIPVIMASNAATAEDTEAYTRAGCCGYLAKPIDGKLFLEMVRKFLPSIERRDVRVPVTMPVRMSLDGCEHMGVSENLALGGIYIATDIAFYSGEEVSLSFVLPGQQTPTEALGKIVWINHTMPANGPGLKPGCGIQFLKITGSGIPFMRMDELKQFIAARS